MPEFKQAPPKYVQIADHIRAQIVRGDMAPGAEVPSERQLAAEWKVARPTVTKALDVLRREGYVESRQGSGTVVVGPSRFHRGAHAAYLRSAETGRIYPANQRAEILSAERVAAPAHVARALRLEESSAVVRRQRLTLRDDEPVELSTSWCDVQLASAAPRILEAERILEGTVAYIAAMTGRRHHHARDRLAARLASREERRHLGLTDPSAVLVTRHLVLDADDRPIEYTESVVPPEAWTIEQEYLVGR